MNSCQNHKNCIEEAFEIAHKICNNNNIRFTKLRQKIFAIICNDHKPSKAYDILKILQTEDQSAKPITVYRTLDFLMEHNLVHKLHISNSYVSCTHPMKHQKCSFLICNDCLKVTECCNKTITEQIDKIGNDNNFKIDDTIIEIQGTCNECLSKKSNN